MGKKCCVYACKTNYSSAKLKSDKISKYRFSKDETEKEKWIKAVRNANFRVSKDTVVCALHWPGFEEIKVNGNLDQKTRPRFVQVYHLFKYQHHLHHQDPQKSLFKHSQHWRRSTISSNKVTLTLKEHLKNQRESLVHLSSFIIEDTHYVQFQKYLNEEPLFLVKIFKDLNFKSHHCGIKCTMSNLSKIE